MGNHWYIFFLLKFREKFMIFRFNSQKTKKMRKKRENNMIIGNSNLDFFALVSGFHCESQQVQVSNHPQLSWFVVMGLMSRIKESSFQLFEVRSSVLSPFLVLHESSHGSDSDLLHIGSKSSSSWHVLHVKRSNFDAVKTSVITATCSLACTTPERVGSHILQRLMVSICRKKWVNHGRPPST